MKVGGHVIVFFVSFLMMAACSFDKKGKEKKDDILSGELSISVDETILPLFLEQKEVFESSYYNAKIHALAKPEVQAVNAVLKGKAQIAFLTRSFSEDEKQYFKSQSINGRVYPVAYDGIVLVANAEAIDTSMRVDDIIALLKGNKVRDVRLVFDNLNSSVLRYFIDLGKLDKVANTYVETLNGSEEVLEEIVKAPHKIGFISYNQYLSLKSSFTEIGKIRILSVLNEDGGRQRYVLPSQASLSTGEYPLKRTIYVLNYQPNMGLGVGFSAFMTGDRGQRIVLKSGLLPVTMPGREIIIRDKIE
ncbi:phosphate ABC transporter [Sphingobacterium sp. SGG-5]|uniref:PstS family phosphate ABC transporter substrate-binding protein n=1 Tax=Sphingobacterium sp. SGG-5 TaxID=2710881 RepID=UPI0013EAF790|nr:substrate-binding domain-containing protein [Sphingobacterium sp. SGG-5]NGM60968.1 phosphate ABC transporter [Sphingobacterium sp. SGG-5]